MQILDLQQRREEQELAQMQQDLSRPAEHRSEPTTPPEYRESSSGFPSAFSRPNRYSTSSLTSPPGLYNRPGRSGSTLISPKSAVLQSRLMMEGLAKSGPASRRNSDEDEKEEAVRQDPTSHRATNAYVCPFFGFLELQALFRLVILALYLQYSCSNLSFGASYYKSLERGARGYRRAR